MTTVRHDIDGVGRLVDAVLLDRDGTLIDDVPYNGDPDRVVPVAGARAALDRLRAAGLRVGVVSNQSGIARGLVGPEAVAAVNARVERLLGPFDDWQVCPHGAEDGCACRKPAPGMVHAAARALGTAAHRCVVVGDIGSDMAAAAAAGALGVLVPTDVTRPAEVAAAPKVVRNLGEAVEWILTRAALAGGAPPTPPAVPRRGVAGERRAEAPTRTRQAGGHVLAVRVDSAGDVLLTGPAIRALRAGADRLTLLCGPRGEAAAALLPGVDELISWHTPWIDPDPKPVDAVKVRTLLDRVGEAAVDEAVIFTSYHQSALPTALLLRLAGVLRISAISTDYPGSLLDVRHRVDESLPEAERALSLAAAAGFPLPAGDDGRLRVRTGGRVPAGLPADGYVVVHPGASVPARAAPPELMRAAVRDLTGAGYRVVVTGGTHERDLTAAVAGTEGCDLGGHTDLAGLAAVLSRAGCLVCANTGPAHLAAAVGTPVVSLFAPTVRYGSWAPYRVPQVRLGDADAPCRDTRAARCPVPGHPCLSSVDSGEIVAAVRLLGGERP